MPLTAGARLGPYEVLGPLGSGGMGQVYRARDTRLGREVALKMVLDADAGDPERLRRLEREARAASSLSHPNILAVHDVGEQDGAFFVVSELLKGETLREAIRKGMRHRTALDYALQIARGLAAAHAKGIVHRDLKPENIFVTDDSRVKILDFGLAKQCVSGDTGLGADTVSRPTTPGVLVGTVAYMSPEQARGLPADARSDIFALGVVLYEMLSGRRPFQGQTAAETLTAILREEPKELTSFDGTIPPAVGLVVRRCIEKRPEERFHSAHDFGLALEVAAGMSTVSGLESQTVFRRPIPRRTTMALAVAALVAAALGGWALGRRAPADQSRGLRNVARFTLALPDGTRTPQNFPTVAISPDGTVVAAVAQRAGVRELYVRPLDQWEWRRLPGTEDAISPFFSPDGNWVGFFGGGVLKRISLLGGTPQVVCHVEGTSVLAPTGSWSEDSTILFATWPGTGIWRVLAGGGNPESLVGSGAVAGARASWYLSPRFLPGRRAVLFSTWSAGRSRVEVLTLDSGQRQVLVDGGDGSYVSTGHLVYSSENQILAAPFDLEKLQVRGVGVPLIEDVRRLQGVPALSNDYALSEAGTLVYAPGARAQKRLVWMDRAGRLTALPFPAGNYQFPALSPDGDRVAVGVLGGPSRNVWVGDLSRGTLSRLTSDGDSVFSLWSPDGRDVVYTSSQAGQYNLFRTSADGSGEPDRLTASGNPQRATSWSPDGRLLLLNEIDAVTLGDVWVLPMDADRKPRPLLKTPATERSGVFSPDGRWIAYDSDESGRFEVYLRAYPGLGQKQQVSTDGGLIGGWNPSGRELLYTNGDQLFSAAIEAGDRLRIAAPRLLFRADLVESPRSQSYDVTRDGQRFLFIQDIGAKESSTRLHVIPHWLDELKRRVPVR